MKRRQGSLQGLLEMLLSSPAGAQHGMYLPLTTAPGTAVGTSTPTRLPPTHTPSRRPTEPAVCLCGANLYNCSDFSTQRSAQACFDYCWAERGFDVHRLDRDDDGIACESLP